MKHFFSLLWTNTSWMQIIAAVFYSTKNGAKHAQSDRVTGKILLALSESYLVHA